MAKQKEEWQSTDSGYLNCIGVGDTYVRKQIERILRENYLKADMISYWPCANGFEDGVVVSVTNPQFENRDDSNNVDKKIV